MHRKNCAHRQVAAVKMKMMTNEHNKKKKKQKKIIKYLLPNNPYAYNTIFMDF